MRIAEQLYFAPNIRFAELDLTGSRLPTQFRQRVTGFYLDPAVTLGRAGHAFASGVLVVCAIDSMALLTTGSNAVGARITAFCKKIPDLAERDNASIFCGSFRNGLVHEARVKNGSEFSTAIERVAIRKGGRLTVNPTLLAENTVKLLDEYVARLNRNPVEKIAFLKKLKKTFCYELQH